MINLESYLQVLGKIQEEYRVDSDGSLMFHKTTLSLMLWGVVYDFMAFCSSKYAHALETNKEKMGSGKCLSLGFQNRSIGQAKAWRKVESGNVLCLGLRRWWLKSGYKEGKLLQKCLNKNCSGTLLMKIP